MKTDTDITVILDRSGSMDALRDDTIGGFNRFLSDQKRGPDVARLSLVTFAHNVTTVYQGRPIVEAPELSRETYEPNGGTALLDAVGVTIYSVGERLRAMPEHDRPGRVLFVIITDGQENASRIYVRARIFEMVEHQRAKYGWNFVYLGANVDSFAEAGAIGIPQGLAGKYQATTRGLGAMYASASANVGSYRGGMSVNSLNWTPEDPNEDSKPPEPPTKTP